MRHRFWLALVGSMATGGVAHANYQLNGNELHGNPMGKQFNGKQFNGTRLSNVTLKNVVVNGSSYSGVVTLALNKTLLAATVNGAAIDARQLISNGTLTATNDNVDGGTTNVELQIVGIKQLAAPNDDVFLYQVQWKDESGAWNDMCLPDPDGTPDNWAIPVAGEWETQVGVFEGPPVCHNVCHKSPGEGGAYECEQVCTPKYTWTGGSRIPNTLNNSFTFGCHNSGAIAKCIEHMGYKPWGAAVATSKSGASYAVASLEPLYEACVRMVRADYCGDGMPHTYDGTSIDVMDYVSIQTPDPTDAYATPQHPSNTPYGPEAEWGPAGALCLSHTRFAQADPTAPVNANLPIGVAPATVQDYINARCPALYAQPTIASCNSNYAAIMGGSVAARTYTPNPDFLVDVYGAPASYIQDFSSTIPAQ